MRGGCLLLLLIVGGFLVYAVQEGGKLQEKEKARPTCVSDYTKCTDNEDVVEHHESKDHIAMNVMCKQAAKDAAKYGTPELPFIAFGTYYGGRSYVNNGVAILVEKDAKFQNAFGAMQHVVATCLYDMKQDQAKVTISAK